MTQIDKSLDESSATLGTSDVGYASTHHHAAIGNQRPSLPPVYSFVRAMTAISAVIFSVSAEYDMATSYIIGRVENNDYGTSDRLLDDSHRHDAIRNPPLQFLIDLHKKLDDDNAKLESI